MLEFIKKDNFNNFKSSKELNKMDYLLTCKILMIINIIKNNK